METKAASRYLQIPARKLRLVADLVRGKNAKEADRFLGLTLKRGAKIIRKTLRSAISNAENRGDIDIDNLYVKTIFVNEGPTQKRWLPRARGSATNILKRSSHLEMVLEER